jgi:hypothetical protein
MLIFSPYFEKILRGHYGKLTGQNVISVAD